MNTSRGSVTLAAGDRSAYFDITLPQLQGRAYKLNHLFLETLGNDTANGGLKVALSNKAVPRTTLVPTEGIPPDVLASRTMQVGPAGTIVHDQSSVIREGIVYDPEAFVANLPYFQYEVRILAYTQTTAIAAGKQIFFSYLLTVDDVRLTDAIQQQIYESAYT